jgi:FixJ family two-component response regulator
MSRDASITIGPGATIGPGCANEVVYLVDDDTPMRDAVDNLLSLHDFRVIAFSSAAAYVAAAKPALPACLVLGVDIPDVDNLNPEPGAHSLPIVFITGRLVSSVRPVRDGAVDFLVKPFSEYAILQAVEAALERDREARREAVEIGRLRRKYRSLTPRERDVLPLIASGFLNKQAAAELGISMVTLQIHRGHIMRKMAARSLAELVRMTTRIGIPVHEGPTAT